MTSRYSGWIAPHATTFDRLGHALRHQHSFSERGRPVVHRSVRDFHAGQLADECLKLEDCLQCALRNFRLIRRVGSKEFGTRNECDRLRLECNAEYAPAPRKLSAARRDCAQPAHRSRPATRFQKAPQECSDGRVKRKSSGMESNSSAAELRPIW